MKLIVKYSFFVVNILITPYCCVYARAAAVRCREKKKEWVQRLVCKSGELVGVNNRLQAEVTSLRAEVATLKQLLLRHSSCDVTLSDMAGKLVASSSGSSNLLLRLSRNTFK